MMSFVVGRLSFASTVMRMNQDCRSERVGRLQVGVSKSNSSKRRSGERQESKRRHLSLGGLHVDRRASCQGCSYVEMALLVGRDRGMNGPGNGPRSNLVLAEGCRARSMDTEHVLQVFKARKER